MHGFNMLPPVAITTVRPVVHIPFQVRTSIAVIIIPVVTGMISDIAVMPVASIIPPPVIIVLVMTAIGMTVICCTLRKEDTRKHLDYLTSQPLGIGNGCR
jgi:hypothetical protein